MICPDINLLLYATFSCFEQHQRAKEWWDSALSNPEPVGIGHVVAMGFIRLATNPKTFKQPLRIKQAVDVVDGWLQQPNVKFLSPPDTHWHHYREMLLASNIGGNLTTDAHIAALAKDYGLIIYSNDADFSRFPGVKTINPLTP